MPSYIIRSMRKMFSHCLKLSYKDTAQQNSYVTIPRAANSFDNTEIAANVGEDIIDSLTGGRLVGSVTSFENFAECPLRYYLRYGVDLKEREEFTFSPVNFGVVLHAVIREVCDEIKKNGESYYLISEEKRREMVKEVSLQLLTYTRTVSLRIQAVIHS